MGNSKIEWTDKTWNPVTGCTKVSQGCKNCYAETFYERFNGKGSFRKVICHEERLQIPKSWKQGWKIFVNSVSDLFHEDVPFDFVVEVFEVMKETPQHTYQVLTKRPERMREFMRDWRAPILKNVMLGVSVEDQAAANERVPVLVSIPAYRRFLSCEPLLGPIDFVTQRSGITGIDYTMLERIDWVIVGGESGHGARPMHPSWAKSIQQQCQEAAIAFFFKQWGNWKPKWAENDFEYRSKVHTFPDGAQMIRCNKKDGGNLLDGVSYLEFPEVVNL